eukprot:PLAT15285.1.p1 GENE.PLAT15285.1~~PLAT15285.1.p1  ORF type:complete len:510 (+),score=168.98 PLAT15285.1:78-1532(+)
MRKRLPAMTMDPPPLTTGVDIEAAHIAVSDYNEAAQRALAAALPRCYCNGRFPFADVIAHLPGCAAARRAAAELAAGHSSSKPVMAAPTAPKRLRPMAKRPAPMPSPLEEAPLPSSTASMPFEGGGGVDGGSGGDDEMAVVKRGDAVPHVAIPASFEGRPPSLLCYLCGKKFGTASLEIHWKSCKRKRVAAQKAMPRACRTRAPPPPAMSIPTRRSTAKQFDAYNELARQLYEACLPRCPNCNRSFSDWSRVEVHMRSCRASPPGAGGSAADDALARSAMSPVAVRRNIAPLPHGSDAKPAAAGDGPSPFSATAPPGSLTSSLLSAESGRKAAVVSAARAERAKRAAAKEARLREKKEAAAKERALKAEHRRRMEMDRAALSSRGGTADGSYLHKGGGRLASEERLRVDEQARLAAARRERFGDTGRFDGGAADADVPAGRPTSRASSRGTSSRKVLPPLGDLASPAAAVPLSPVDLMASRTVL